MANPESQPLTVTVVYSPAPRQVREWSVVWPAGPAPQVQQVLAACPLWAEFPALQDADLALGVWGRKVSVTQTLQDGDRLEIYRPLQVDPKAARRERFNRQGIRTAGLFAGKKCNKP